MKFDEVNIASIAKQALLDCEMWQLPVDPLKVASEFGIELAPGRYSDSFDGSIRYYSAEQAFILSYAIVGPGRTFGRVNFTVGHEIGHYLLHRGYLETGHYHSSVVDFRSEESMEKEADAFSAALLMPMELFREFIAKRWNSVCNLSNLMDLASRTLRTSLTSTVRRYCEADIEPCGMVFSEAGRVRWYLVSGDFRRRGLVSIDRDEEVPASTKTGEVWRDIHVTRAERPVEKQIVAREWFRKSNYAGDLWEEVYPLGNTGFVLTFLTLPLGKK